MRLILTFFCALILAFGVTGSRAQTTADNSEVQINKRPLRDFGTITKRKIESGEVDLNAPFRIEFQTVFDSSAKLDLTKSRIVSKEGDEKLVALARDAILAIGDSGFFGYLTRLDPTANGTLIVMSQDNASFEGSLNTPAKDAQSHASNLRLLLAAAQQAAGDGDVKLFLSHTDVTADGITYIIKFRLPVGDFHRLVGVESKKQAP